jgi:transcriptional regulator GlxA family with amidase domain
MHPYIGLRIDLDLDLARQVMADIDVQAPDVVLPESPLALGRIEPALFDAVARLVRLIEAPQDVGFMSGLIHREILYRLLQSPAGRKLRLIVQLGAQGNRVAKAVSWLQSHFRERLRVGQLADIAGMAQSTLYRHFQELTGMSPIQYQKRLRLHKARHLMLEGRLDVGSAALSVGYESPTQFVREYRRLFGESPLRDVKALRADGRRQLIR